MIGTNEGIILSSSDCNNIGSSLGAADGIELRIYEVTVLGSSDGYFGGSNDGTVLGFFDGAF